MRNNIGALAEPQRFYNSYFYPRKFKPDYGLDEWLFGIPFLSLAEQLAERGGLMPWEDGKIFKVKRIHANYLLDSKLDL